MVNCCASHQLPPDTCVLNANDSPRGATLERPVATPQLPDRAAVQCMWCDPMCLCEGITLHHSSSYMVYGLAEVWHIWSTLAALQSLSGCRVCCVHDGCQRAVLAQTDCNLDQHA